jgi:phosphatidylglycerophosphate synthase
MLRELLRALPNAVSLSRLALAAAFLSTDHALTRALLVASAAATDALDGWIARAAGVTSRAGAFIDPLADRTFAILATAALLFDGVFTTPQYFILLARDIMTMVGFVVARLMPTLRTVPFQARQSGKLVTVLQFFCLFVALARPSWAAPFVYLVGLASLVSIVDYTMGLVRARRAALAALANTPTAPADPTDPTSDATPSATPSVAPLLWCGLAPLGLALLWGAPLAAQRAPGGTLRSEWRLEAATPTRVDLGAGASLAAGRNLRVATLLAFGVADRGVTAAPGAERYGTSARIESTLRFTLDPWEQSRWGLYAASGVGVLCRAGSLCEAALLLRAGLEGPLRRGWRPALEVGIGHGVHVAVAWRRGVRGRR